MRQNPLRLFQLLLTRIHVTVAELRPCNQIVLQTKHVSTS